MTNAASKAQRVIEVSKCPHQSPKILVCVACFDAAISAAVAEERERAGKLVEAAKAVQELQPKIGESPLIALRRHKKTHEQMQVIWNSFDTALQAYEVRMSDRSMTPERRAAEIVTNFMREGLRPTMEMSGRPIVPSPRLVKAIAAALQPSAAVRELLRAADELRTIMHLDGTTKTPRYDKAAAAVRQELGL